jgi:hypothetical protein
MEDEERAHRDAHFQEELESLKASVAHLTKQVWLTSLAYLSKHLEMPLVNVLPTSLLFLFSLQQQLNPKKQWVNMVKNLHTIQHFYT